MRELTESEAEKQELAKMDALAEAWVGEAGWREQLDQLAHMSTVFAGRRATGAGGAECRMLILRQRGLIDQWVRQAFIEGVLKGQGYKLTAEGRRALSDQQVKP